MNSHTEHSLTAITQPTLSIFISLCLLFMDVFYQFSSQRYDNLILNKLQYDFFLQQYRFSQTAKTAPCSRQAPELKLHPIINMVGRQNQNGEKKSTKRKTKRLYTRFDWEIVVLKDGSYGHLTFKCDQINREISEKSV